MDITKRRSLNGFFISHGIRITLDLSNKYKSQANKAVSKFIEPNHWECPSKYLFNEVLLENSKIYTMVHKDKKPTKVIYLLHGGSYVGKLNKMYFKMATKFLSFNDDIMVALLDYRTAPDYVFPAALLDAIEGYNYLLNNKFTCDQIIVVGDSAGGNLAIALTMSLRDYKRELPKALILMSPWTDMIDSGASRIYNLYNDPMFGLSKNGKRKRLPDVSYAGKVDLKHPYLSPIFGSFKNFPPTLIQVGTNEILESDSINIYKKALVENVDVTLSRYHRMFHVFQSIGNILPESRIAWQEIKDFSNKYL